MTDLNQSPTPSGGGRPLRPTDQTPPSGSKFDAEMLVEQAKGVVMFCRGISADDSGEVLLEWSIDRGVPLATVARVLVHDISQGARPGGTDQDLVRWLEHRLWQ